MISLVDLAQFGAVIFISGALCYVVDKLLKAQAKKDEDFIKFINKQEENFNKVITNHLHDTNNIMNKFKESNNALSSAVQALLMYLNNNKR